MDRRLATALWIAAAVAFTVWSVSASAQQAFAPGRVDARHAKKVKKCTGCHDALKGAPDAKCLKCHKKTARDQGDAATAHGRTSKPCAACHRIHGKSLGDDLLSAAADLHPPGGFFAGKHIDRPCRQCHKEGEPKKISTACEGCHQRESLAHGPTVVEPCGICHLPDNWRRLRVDHSPGADCSACHAPRGNHPEGPCSSCHTTNTWRTNALKHPRVRGHSYIEFECSACHPNGYESASCNDCHNRGGGRGFDGFERDHDEFEEHGRSPDDFEDYEGLEDGPEFDEHGSIGGRRLYWQ